MHPQVDDFFRDTKAWKTEMEYLRSIVADCGLTEDFKWKQPCYTYKKSNILIISGFKDYCALNFFKGSLLSDTENIMTAPGENTQSGRQIRFTNVKQIRELETTLKAYIYEAIEVEKAGLKVEYKTAADFPIPDELQLKFQDVPGLKTAFETLTPGRQKAYLIHFTEPKQSQTRTNRIERFIPRILMQKGPNDCVCGHSKRMPSCDGSHKHFQKK